MSAYIKDIFHLPECPSWRFCFNLVRNIKKAEATIKNDKKEKHEMKKSMTIIRLFICIKILSVIISPAFADPTFSDSDINTFFPGEKLTYCIKWGYIPAGYAYLEVLPNETWNEQPVFHFQLKARTNSFVSKIYEVSDQIDSYVSISRNRTVHYKKRVREGRTRRDITVYFNLKNQTAQYKNFDQYKPPISIPKYTFDPLSAFYYVRLFKPDKTKSIFASVTDGKKCVAGKVRYIKQETISVPYGSFDTWLIEPDIKDVGGVFEKSKNAKIQIWITNDERRIPVLLRSKVIVGSFYAELIKIE
jgi:hypothetical protein